MEILHFCPSRSFSGLEQYALQVASDQRKRGLEVGFVVSPGSRLETECQKNDIQTVSFNPYSFFWPLEFWPRFSRLLKEQKSLKVLHLHSTQEISHLSLPLAWIRRRAIRPKVILQCHIWINHRKKDLLHTWLYSLVDEVWCSSQAARESLVRALPVSVQKIKIVRYGRDVDLLSRNFLSRGEARKQLGLPSQGIFFGSVSRLEKSKGVVEFIDAGIPLLQNRKDLHIAVIGGASPEDSAAEAYAQDLKQKIDSLPSTIKERIHLLGTVAESYKFLKAFDVYVLPSYQETFSLSLLDAQLAGLPVVGSDSGGTPDIVKMNSTGWLFPPGDVSALRSRLKEALDANSSWDAYGKKAAEGVRENFDQKNVFQEILSGYEVRP